MFIQYNAKVDGSFEPLAARHVDTGMGFERVAGILATTNHFQDFSQPPSNYNADLFTGIFAKLSELSGKSYARTLPVDPANPTDVEASDIVFRVLADHIRTLCCAIADGILPGNEGRNYTLRRILRRAVMYGRRLDLKAGFFSELITPCIESLEVAFPELRDKETLIRKFIANEEASFDRTLDRGMQLFEGFASAGGEIKGADAFQLYDTHGFPLDLTEILARERGMSVDSDGFNVEMEAQKQRGLDSQIKSIIEVVGDVDPTEFSGYGPENLEAFESEVLELLEREGEPYLVTPATPFYAEMGGQVGDEGSVEWGAWSVKIEDTVKDSAGRFLHKLSAPMQNAEPGTPVKLSVNVERRRNIQRHHSATHILNWALRESLGDHVVQAGSFVGPDRLRFDFNHFEAIPADQLAEIEAMVNRALIEDDAVVDFEVPFDEKPEEVIAAFGEKYGNVVRVVDIGGFSKELCGGTHVGRIGEIGQLRIVGESSISAGVRRIEAVVGEAAAEYTAREHGLLQSLSGLLSVKPEELPGRLEVIQQKQKELEKSLQELRAEAAKAKASDLESQVQDVGGVKLLAAALEGVDAKGLRDAMDGLRQKLDPAVIVLGGAAKGKVFFNVSVAKECQEAGAHAGQLVGPIAKICGGGGGGKADRAQAGGKDPAKLQEALEQVPELLQGLLG